MVEHFHGKGGFDHRSGHKESRNRLIDVREPVELREALAAVLGITVVVAKVRRLFVCEGVRIHLDHIDGLGDFIEFEGVLADGDCPGRFADLLDDLRRRFGIGDEDLLRESYSDLVRSGFRPLSNEPASRPR